MVDIMIQCSRCKNLITKPGISFCPTCGMYLYEKNDNASSNETNSYNYNFSNANNKSNNNRSNKQITLKGSYVAVILIILSLLLLVGKMLMPSSTPETDYYFDGVNNQNDDGSFEKIENEDKEKKDGEVVVVTPPIEKQDENIDYSKLTGVSKSGVNPNKNNRDETQIIHDKQYFKQLKLDKDSQVFDLINYDSVSQKKGCSSSILNIENEIINNYGIRAVNLCEMDISFANELRNVAKYVYDTYPNARNHLTNLTLANVGDATYMASFMPIFTFVTSSNGGNYPIGIKTQIYLNSKYFLNIGKINNSVSYGAKNGYFPPNATKSSTVAHEFGHYLSYVALLKYYNVSQLTYVMSSRSSRMYDIYNDFDKGLFSKKIIEEAYNKFSKDTSSNIGFDNFRASISTYAMAKDNKGNYIYDETIAEAFHDVYLNNSKAKSASRYIVYVLNSKL